MAVSSQQDLLLYLQEWYHKADILYEAWLPFHLFLPSREVLTSDVQVSTASILSLQSMLYIWYFTKTCI